MITVGEEGSGFNTTEMYFFMKICAFPDCHDCTYLTISIIQWGCCLCWFHPSPPSQIGLDTPFDLVFLFRNNGSSEQSWRGGARYATSGRLIHTICTFQFKCNKGKIYSIFTHWIEQLKYSLLVEVVVSCFKLYVHSAWSPLLSARQWALCVLYFAHLSTFEKIKFWRKMENRRYVISNLQFPFTLWSIYTQYVSQSLASNPINKHYTYIIN